MTTRDDRRRRTGSALHGIGSLLVMFAAMLAAAAAIAGVAMWLVG